MNTTQAAYVKQEFSLEIQAEPISEAINFEMTEKEQGKLKKAGAFLGMAQLNLFHPETIFLGNASQGDRKRKRESEKVPNEKQERAQEESSDYENQPRAKKTKVEPSQNSTNLFSGLVEPSSTSRKENEKSQSGNASLNRHEYFKG